MKCFVTSVGMVLQVTQRVYLEVDTESKVLLK